MLYEQIKKKSSFFFFETKTIFIGLTPYYIFGVCLFLLSKAQNSIKNCISRFLLMLGMLQNLANLHFYCKTLFSLPILIISNLTVGFPLTLFEILQ